MFLTDNYTIKEVILFPAMKPVENSNESIAPVAVPPSSIAPVVVPPSQTNDIKAILSEAIYLTDSYLFKGEATVLDIRLAQNNNDATVILNQTLFHPQGGGQPSDIGLLEFVSDGVVAQFQVTQVTKNPNGEITHKGIFKEGRFNVGDKVVMTVDSDRRVLHARYHSAGHLLDDALSSLSLNWKAGKRNHIPGDAYVFYQISGTPPDLEKTRADLEAAINGLISSNKSRVEVESVPFNQVQALCGEEPPQFLPKDQNVRIVRVKGPTGACFPCAGTHVKSIGEIGTVIVHKLKVKSNRVTVSYDLK